MESWKWRMRFSLWKRDLLDLKRSIRFKWWCLVGFPYWPSLDSVQASRLGLTPIDVWEETGKVDSVFSIDFQSGEVVQYAGRLVNYTGEHEAETTSRFFGHIHYNPRTRQVICRP